ncbi:MAG: type IV secretory system conjugative DNA transfer family protein [Synergistaceae bacterium]|nr:type IV secretory system conjugative DNA transfer family protein [Synergistaceae bacterium]
MQGSYGYQEERKVSSARILKGVLLASLIVALTSMLATQHLAKALHYHPALGTPLFSFPNRSLFFNPLAVWTWLYPLLINGGIRLNTLLPSLSILFAGCAIAVLVVFLSLLRKSAGESIENVHGSARWAKRQDLIEAGLIPRPGAPVSEISVYTGGWFDSQTQRLLYLTHAGPEHILAFAPTRSGKGVGLVVPSLLRWADSILVYDIKGENYQLTSGWRKEELGSIVIRLDPTDPDAFEHETSGTFNPLDELPLDYDWASPDKSKMKQVGSGETAAVQNLVTMIVDPDGKGLEDHWAKTAHSLIVGCITHLLYVGKQTGKTPCLADVANEFTKKGVPWRTTIGGWQKYPHLGGTVYGPIVHPVVDNAAQEALNREDKEASSVLSTVVSYLTLYRDPVIARNTSHSSFRIKDLMNHEKPVSLYLVVKPVDKDRIRPFVRLFITQIIRRLADSMKFENGEQVKTYKHRLLLMLDEFPSLGKLQIFEEALAFIAGYGMKAYLIIQDIAQLHKIYGKDEAITGNCHVKVAYATSNPDTARYLSESSGITTIIKEAETLSGDRTAVFKKGSSVSVQEISRPLMTVDECMRLRGPEKNSAGRILVPGDMLIFIAGYAAVYGKQMLYFLDGELSRRSKIKAPEHSDRLTEKVNVKKVMLSAAKAPSGPTHPDEPSAREIAQLTTIMAINTEDIEEDV